MLLTSHPTTRRLALTLALAALGLFAWPVAAATTLPHVRDDVSREFCKDDNAVFGREWQKAPKDRFDDGSLCDQVIARAKKR